MRIMDVLNVNGSDAEEGQQQQEEVEMLLVWLGKDISTYFMNLPFNFRGKFLSYLSSLLAIQITTCKSEIKVLFVMQPSKLSMTSS